MSVPKKLGPKSNCGEIVAFGEPGYPKFPPDMRAFRVLDNSMAPIIPKGGSVWLCPDRDDEVEDGSLVVALLSDGRCVRRCFLYGDLVVLTSMNVLAKPRVVNRADCRLWPVIGIEYLPKNELLENDAVEKGE